VIDSSIASPIHIMPVTSEQKTHDYSGCKTFTRFTQDLNDNLWEVLGTKKIFRSLSSSTMHME